MVAMDIWEKSVLQWRLAMFEEMGFNPVQAKVLAEAPGVGKLGDGWLISTHAVRRILRNGCSHDLAMRIVL